MVGNEVNEEFEVMSAIVSDEFRLGLGMFKVCNRLPRPVTGLLACRPIVNANGELPTPRLHPDVVRMGLFKAAILLALGHTKETLCTLAVRSQHLNFEFLI